MFKFLLTISLTCLSITAISAAKKDNEIAAQNALMLSCLKCFETGLFQSCALQCLTDARPYFKTGIPELGIPPIDPFYIRSMNLTLNETGPFQRVKATIYNVTARGAAAAKIKSVQLENWHITIKFEIPQVRMNGMYDIKGHLSGVPFVGNSTFFLVVAGCTADFKARLVYSERTQLFNVITSQLKFDVKTGRIRMNNMGGDVDFSQVANAMFNENFPQIKEMFVPVFNSEFKKIFNELLGGVLSKIPTTFSKRLVAQLNKY